MVNHARQALARTARILLVLAAAILLMQRSALPFDDNSAAVRLYTRDLEFDYIEWTLNAVWVKFNQSALGLNRYLDDELESRIVLEFIDMTRRIQEGESQLRSIYADPEVEDGEAAAAAIDARLAEDYALKAQLGPLAESILQDQVSSILRALGITIGGQAIPPVLYRMTPAPMALIVSPRDVIRQSHNISIRPEMTVEEQIALEDAVADGLGVSTLVVPIGGIGVYPTMVMQTSSINWLAEVVPHEWSHNFFSLRPLGVSYLATPELRTMNETAATLVGKEIGRLLIERYYPEFAPPPPEPASQAEPAGGTGSPLEPVFDFRAEMRETRVNTDRLLAEGKVKLAEQYMELRRRFFWDNGYRIRKLNQAYFAFYGAYADVPGGAAGDDPVAAAVRRLWEESNSLRDFIRTISWMSSYGDLQAFLTP